MSYAGPIACVVIAIMIFLTLYPHKVGFWHRWRRTDTMGDVVVTLEHGFLAGTVCGGLAVYWMMS